MSHLPLASHARRFFPLAALLLSACASQAPAPIAPSATASPPPACPPVPAAIPAPAAAPVCPACPACPQPAVPASATPPAAPLQRADWSDLPGWREDDPVQAWPALRQSCKVLVRQPRWQAVCDAALALGEQPPEPAVRRFFETRFAPWAVVNPDGSREGLVTGYYEPLIKGSRTASERFRWPVHGTPRDMLTIELGDVYPDLKGMRLRGRVVGNKVLPYWTRAELDRMQAPTLLWAADPIDLFFLQVQGSGRVELPDGTLLRVGYADQNGHPYQSIGRWLVAQGELPLEKASMEGIKEWARRNPQRLPELLNANPSYVFFREMPAGNGGPIGALGVPLTAGRSIATDPRTVPLGAPVFLETTWPRSERPLRRLVVAQDTGGAIKGAGGAIKGAVRADYFWGFGPEAGAEAGKMRQQGRMWVLLPAGQTP